MNEEEIKIIEYMKLELEMTGDMPKLIFYRNQIECILKLLEKQQKEIEKLKDDLKEERALNVEALKTLKECVHKDKIKGLIQEIESYAYTSLEEREKQDYAIYELKRLLGE